MSLKYVRHSANWPAIGGTVATTSAHASYPITNIYNERLAKCWRSNGVLSNVDITFDAGTARAIDLVGLCNHNLTSAATIAIAAGTTSGVSDFSTSATWRAGCVYAEISQNYRYWRIRLTDAANSDGFLEAGYLLISTTTTPDKAVSLNLGITLAHQAQNLVVESEYGSPSVDELVERTSITLGMMNMTESEYIDAVTDFLKSMREESDPLFLIPDNNYYDGWYCRLQEGPRIQRGLYNNMQPVTFLEDGSGRRIGA